MQTMRRRTVSLAVMMLALASILALATTAQAVQSDQYDSFTACPTNHPALNDPSREFAVCTSLTADEGSLHIEDRTLPLSGLDVQFAITGATPDEPDCPPENTCFGRVPGSTAVNSAVSEIMISPSRGKADKGKKGKGNAHRLKINVESAGDVVAVNLAFFNGLPVPVFKLPVKLSLDAPWLGENCRIGSDSDPIYFGPITLTPPASFEFLPDPNGFPVETLGLIDMPVLDNNLAIPEAEGCGHGKGRGSDRNAEVNEILNLPSPAGQNALSLPHINLRFAAAGYDGTPLDGGAALQAAFDAAE